MTDPQTPAEDSRRTWAELCAESQPPVIVGREPPPAHGTTSYVEVPYLTGGVKWQPAPDDRDRQTGAAAVYALLGAGALLALAVAVAVLR